MAKRRGDLSGKLGGEAAPVKGWQDQVGRGTPAAPAPEKLKRKTYLVTQALEDRIRHLAEQERVGQNELVRYLLDYALKQVESGEHQLPAEPVQQRTLGV